MPLGAGDRVASRFDPDREGIVIGQLGQPPPGKPRVLEVRWDDGTRDGVSEPDLIEPREKRAGLSGDGGRCPSCKYPLPSHAPNCKLKP